MSGWVAWGCIVIKGYVTDETLRTRYRCTRAEYFACPPSIRRKYRAYLQRRKPRLTLPQFRLMVSASR